MSRSGADGREIILGLYSPGQIFGELCFCEVRARQEHAIAMEASSVATLSADLFLECLREDPQAPYPQPATSHRDCVGLPPPCAGGDVDPNLIGSRRLKPISVRADPVCALRARTGLR